MAARAEGVTREAYERAIDERRLFVGPSLRAAMHALAPTDSAIYGPALIADDDAELAEQLGPTLKRSLAELGIAASDALCEVGDATAAALGGGRPLTKDELHADLRVRVRPELLPWCRGCGTHHVSPMLWRFAGVSVGMRTDSRHRFVIGEPGPWREPAEAARRFLRFYGPVTVNELTAWAGLARAHSRRLWSEIEDELVEVRVEGRRAWLLREDEAALESPPSARGVRLLPPRDPYLQQYDRATLVPDPQLRKRLLRPVASPGAVLQDGRLSGLWRARARGLRTELEVEKLDPINLDDLEAEAAGVSEARGNQGVEMRVT